jgi:acyl-CoA synthetase (AMP-forming)/AMP-acid ligase II
MKTPLTPLRCLHRAIDLFADKPGVVCGQEEFTYRQFGERCQMLATGLRAKGIKEGDRVAYLSLNNHMLLEGYFGVVQAGAIVMPMNVRLTPSELATILNDSGARMLLFEAAFAPLVEALKPNCPAIKTYVSLGAKPVAPADIAYEEIIDAGVPQRTDISKIDEGKIAELFYTSGSTGKPKGVMLSHRTLYLHALALFTVYQDVDSMVNLHTIPLFHANGWGHPQASTYFGVKQVMVNRFDPATVIELIEKHAATDMYLVPVMANMLLNAPEIKQAVPYSLRRIVIGGAATSPALIERMEAALGCEVIAGYGLSETGPILAVSLPKAGIEYESEDERFRRQAMTGWPLIGNEVRVVDAEMKNVPRDREAIGEIVARGDHVMEGYWNDPEGTAAVFTDGWLHTGDMAVWDEESYIQIVDRRKEIIISGGENVSSVEIESVIFSHPAVLECAVVAAPDDKWGEVPAAIIVLKPDHALTKPDLKAFLGGKLAKFKIPRHVEFRSEALPKTGTGKIRKLDLKEAFWKGKDRRVQG